MKSVCLRRFSGPYFPAFALNMKRYSVSLHIQSECEKKRTSKTPNTDTFHVVNNTFFKQKVHYYAEIIDGNTVAS